VDPAHVDVGAVVGERGLGHAGVPDVGETLPSALAANEETGLDDVLAEAEVVEVVGEAEALGDDRADREVEGVVGVVGTRAGSL
jgi:hypothetical protein